MKKIIGIDKNRNKLHMSVKFTSKLKVYLEKETHNFIKDFIVYFNKQGLIENQIHCEMDVDVQSLVSYVNSSYKEYRSNYDFENIALEYESFNALDKYYIPNLELVKSLYMLSKLDELTIFLYDVARNLVNVFNGLPDLHIDNFSFDNEEKESKQLAVYIGSKASYYLKLGQVIDSKEDGKKLLVNFGSCKHKLWANKENLIKLIIDEKGN